ncbi:unnamed protein product [Rhizophagus irregularis]|uniref:Uncharacterized protein n=1 Tax=Rhizophagus irregularis TaxID=588596 RepID=A0A916EMR8_9GLOM|nr:unnamed protein product [Rhizophagus irregularis]CAB5395713.1 unnamed protein product [Rhizophagus irregularis]
MIFVGREVLILTKRNFNVKRGEIKDQNVSTEEDIGLTSTSSPPPSPLVNQSGALHTIVVSDVDTFLSQFSKLITRKLFLSQIKFILTLIPSEISKSP